MSLKRRNIIAWILIFLAASLWTFGQRALQSGSENAVSETSFSPEDFTASTSAPVPAADTTYEASTLEIVPSFPGETGRNEMDTKDIGRSSKILGILLCFAAVGAASAAIFLFSQKAPALGPDGTGFLTAIYFLVLHHALIDLEYVRWVSLYDFGTAAASILTIFIALFAVRELWGWIRAKCSLGWCLAYRIAKRCPLPQLSLLSFAGWIVLALGGIAYSLFSYQIHSLIWISCCSFAAAAFFGVICLWIYGADLNHLKQQLTNYQSHLPITVKEGAFTETEAQLLEIQAQHKEAVRTAVTSERFKVELISNVSHDLRTPLTSILGYSELLQKEALSPEGQEQLRRLHQKAGYMNDLVDSLFELTKVSSGVIDAKKEQIDLIRLLEQTVGLFDDQLTQAGLQVKRSYPADSISIATDGARMHHVFANLLGNAMKYALKGTRIYLDVKEQADNYLIRMVNTASYEMDFRPEEIMQRFARGDKARSTKGSGLGLAIAQTYTESVGGRFYVAIDGDQFSAVVELPRTERNL